MNTVTTTKRKAINRVGSGTEDPKALKRKLFLLMLKKAKLNEEDMMDMFTTLWIGQNLDLLTEEELEPYKKYIIQC